ncbi:hypothetical protein JAAARDRAFT_202673 [Jaapia argillacea MUCL 33604]|uniref:FAM86 N-terminal domain-containing protein n=1 Tax=Jaapia argillacea MUCL 33604 TaxID=933084 RepID=A0A067QAG9_9AGAM|nr:hypothetical protein JAAARDRAFT_202673 [Jaapia argillacea MUCL 33604]
MSPSLRLDLFDILRGYAAVVPPRILHYPDDLPWDEMHHFLLDYILLNSHFKKYPPSSAYQHSFWKWAIAHLESTSSTEAGHSQDDEIDARIYEHYTSLLQFSKPQVIGTLAPPQSSFVTHFWSNELGTPANPIDISVLQTTTLRESGAFTENGTTGLRTWPASLALAQFLIMHSDIVCDRRVLELGSGAGLLGIVVTTLQQLQRGKGMITTEDPGLWMTDVHYEVLRLCRENIALPCNKSHSHPNTHQEYLDWASALDLGQSASLTSFLQKVDAQVVLGADVVYDPSIIPALLEVIRLALSAYSEQQQQQQKVAYMALTVRNEATFSLFLTAAEHAFVIRHHLVTSDGNFMFAAPPEGTGSLKDTIGRIRILEMRKRE